MNTTAIQLRILDILRRFESFDTYYYSESQRQISLIDDSSEDVQILDIEYLPYTILKEINKQMTYPIHLYICPDNTLIQFEDPETLSELEITQWEIITNNLIEYWD